MAYVINRYNGTVLTNVQDGTVDQTTELKFIGKNYAGYGEAQNENFLFLLENFAGTTAPGRPLSGMIWYDSVSSKLKIYDGSRWKTTSGAEVSTTEPVGLSEGDLWWNNSTNQLYAKNSSNEWILVGPQQAGSGVTQMQSLILTSTVSTTHAVIAATIEDNVIYIISPDEFTLAASSAITGFDVIKKGLTLINTTASTNGVTSSDHYYWGTASNSLRLNGRPASDYLTVDSAVFTGIVRFGDLGYTVGNDNDLIVNIDTDTETPVFKLVRNLLRIKNNTDGVILSVNNAGISPGTDSTFSLGTASLKWNQVHANTFVGVATQADTLKVGADYRTATTSATANTIASRDASGNIEAVIFNGTATKARYADLAEKYTTDEEYPVGTAMAVCLHNEHETCAAKASDICIGVISAEPAYMMNSELENGQYIGLKGRVPVRVTGPVKKGQAVYAWHNGVCSAITTTAFVGVALETNDNQDEKLVECVLKV
jgi:hypothetical protein